MHSVVKRFAAALDGLRGDVRAYTHNGESYWTRDMSPTGAFVRVDQILPLLERVLAEQAARKEGETP